MSRFGYARVSTVGQDHASQVARLKEAGCNPIRAEKVSGKALEGRDELASLMEFLRAGDELVVVKLDRLGRSTRDLLNLVHELGQKGAYLSVLEPAFSTKDAAGSLLVTVLGMVAEMEREFILERQKAGIEAAKARGAYKGRPAIVSSEKVKQLKASGLGATAIAKELGISRVHVHRLLKPMGQEAVLS
ncbi:MAG: recombinase family protein [Janthinobacterium lividum]